MPNSKIKVPGLLVGHRDLPKLTEAVRLGLLLALIAVSLCIISEISKRQQLLIRITERIGEINGELAEQQLEDEELSAAAEAGRREELVALHALRWQTRALIDRGAHGRPAYALVRLEEREFHSSYLPSAYRDWQSALQTGAAADVLQEKEQRLLRLRGDPLVRIAGLDGEPRRMDVLGVELRALSQLDVRPRAFSSDSLAAILILLCAALGSVAMGLRGNLPTTVRDLELGVASGVVVLFLIKGGQVVFVVDGASEHASAFNPYSIALAGLIAGFFTDRAFQLLASRAPVAEEEAAPTNRPTRADRQATPPVDEAAGAPEMAHG